MVEIWAIKIISTKFGITKVFNDLSDQGDKREKPLKTTDTQICILKVIFIMFIDCIMYTIIMNHEIDKLHSRSVRIPS